MNVKPLADRVLIEPNPAEEKTAGGLFIPDTAKEKPLAGKVIAAGPGTSDVKMEVKVGDQVLYGKYAGTEITIDGKDYLLMKPIRADFALLGAYKCDGPGSQSPDYRTERLILKRKQSWQKRSNTIPKPASCSRKASTRWLTQ